MQLQTRPTQKLDHARVPQDTSNQTVTSPFPICNFGKLKVSSQQLAIKRHRHCPTVSASQQLFTPSVFFLLSIAVQAEYDPNYVCFSCITGTVDKVEPLEGPSGTWLKFTMRVPTPNTEQSFTM